ncbi:probable ATP-dependent RNA helicase Dbp73D [Tribolium madens]|uniref:probable ATP-dependent RNA helicase Dbp73D n=1 Tax=Tribolium madens TaxID=41895 RepID=UPI001CF73D3D|nr:probable ATP-dependent RNA helicase Dbp73D [Tribolium madens]
MELFVINRHGDPTPEVTHEEETAKLATVLKRIERKKQQRIRQREREREKRRVPEPVVEAPQPVPEAPIPPPAAKPPISNFTILGAETTAKRPKTARVLPQWLTNPTLISSDLQELTWKVSKLKALDRGLRERLRANGVRYLFPVQAEVIPWLLQVRQNADIMFPRDVCVSAPTGSGKTLAFVLPVVQTLKRFTVRKIRALVILPTQDLAEQVFKSFKLYTQGTKIEVGLISGKHLFNFEQKQLVYFNAAFGFVSKIDILVCTAGRLVNHLKLTEGFDLKSLEFLIIDEADRVLESVQDDWLYHLERHICVQNHRVLNLCTLRGLRAPQKLLFSATLTQDPEKIEKLSLFQPKLFMGNPGEEKSGKYTTPRELTEKYIVCAKDVKPLVLYAFLKRENLTKTLIFTHSVESAHRLKILLKSLFKNRLKIEEISSNLKGKNRDEFISSFTKGEIDLLICTDFLARGIDLPGVNCVVSYSAPKYLKTYIHRGGRTARAGESGVAVTLLHEEQVPAFKALLKKEIEEVEVGVEELEGMSERYKKALRRLKEAVNKEEKVGMDSVLAKKKALKKLKKKINTIK